MIVNFTSNFQLMSKSHYSNQMTTALVSDDSSESSSEALADFDQSSQCASSALSPPSPMAVRIGFHNGDVYRGECQAYRAGVCLHGKGVMTYANGEIHNQQWSHDDLLHDELVQVAVSENTIKCGRCQQKGHNRRTCSQPFKRKAMVEEDSVVVKKNPFAVGEEVLVMTKMKGYECYEDAIVVTIIDENSVLVRDDDGKNERRISVDFLKNKSKFDTDYEKLSIRNKKLWTDHGAIEYFGESFATLDSRCDNRSSKKRKIEKASEEESLRKQLEDLREENNRLKNQKKESQHKNPTYTLCPKKILANKAFVEAVYKVNGIGRIGFLETAALNTVNHLLKSGVGENSHLDLINYDPETAARIGVEMAKLKKSKEGLGDYSIHMMSSSSFLRGETRSFKGLWLDYECTFSDKVENNDLQYVFKNGLFDAGGGVLALTVCLRNDQGRSKQVHAVITKLAEDNGYTRKSLDMNGDGIQFTEEDASSFQYRNMKLFLYEIRKKIH